MKQYFRYFRWLFIATGALAIVFAGILLLHSLAGPVERTNAECTETERVFDYGEVLSVKEEEKLRKLIAKREKQTGCDIVLITLNESLKEYARSINDSVPYDEFVKVYAGEFYNNNKMGYDKPIGDGVVLIDNWYREDDGRVYTWLYTNGRVEKRYSRALVDHLLDNVYRYIKKDPYKAYKTYVNEFYHDMTGTGTFTAYVNYYIPLGAAAVAMLIFVLIHWSYKKGSKTVSAVAYVNGGKPRINKREDVFLNKVVTKRHIPRNSGGSGGSGSSGGGGGGGSHGGGHSR